MSEPRPRSEQQIEAHRDRKVLVTGANGQIALQLFARLANAGTPALAVVRSQRAAQSVGALPESIRPEVRVLDYTDADALAEAASSCSHAVHLVGILKEGAAARYKDAHEETCLALVSAASRAGLQRIVYLSIFGADLASTNTCLASKARAEDILIAGKTPVSVLRVPMVVGPDDPASRALRAQARKSVIPLVAGGTTLQQPLDIRDLLAAIHACLDLHLGESEIYDLGGPETLRHRELVLRAAALYGNTPRIVPLPIALIRGIAALMERFSANPPLTRAMLGVLEHDDVIDSSSATQALGLDSTPLDETLRRYIGPEAEQP
jgi:nucleoside-diphosphate-sugar epimerase